LRVLVAEDVEIQQKWGRAAYPVANIESKVFAESAMALIDQG
jgi:hypothetical protein